MVNWPRARITELKRWLGAEQLIYAPAQPAGASEDASAFSTWAAGVFDSVLWVGGPGNWTVEDSVLEVVTQLPIPARPALLCIEACPELLDQLQHCRKAKTPMAVLVAGASLVLSPPPEPAQLEDWPTMGDVVDAARFGDQERYLAVWEDVLYSVPRAQALAFAGSLQHEAGRAAMVRTRDSFVADARAATQTLATLGRTLWSRARQR